ncbi:MAG: deoxyhypusine synthase [Spirochaetota bacterium]|nr:deoxyhypusine synthase [Spirochaetota bacterium]
MEKRDLLKETITQIDFTSFDSSAIIAAMQGMSFSSRETARAAAILKKMVDDPDCTVILTLAGSTSAAGCQRVYADMVELGMVDAVVATGASIVDMDFFEALGFRHYKGSAAVDDRVLRGHYIDRIYDTFIDEDELQTCDRTIGKIADSLPPGPYSSRAFIREMGRFLAEGGYDKPSLVRAAYEHDVPVFCPAFSDSSAGFGLVMHQESRDAYVSIDSVKDFRELTEIKIRSGQSGLFMIGGGVPKNFAQDTVVCAEMLGRDAPMHKYAVQITVADVRDGACSSSTLKEASSWGKVDTVYEQMVFAEATTVVPLLASYLYYNSGWKSREPRMWARIFS